MGKTIPPIFLRCLQSSMKATTWWRAGVKSSRPVSQPAVAVDDRQPADFLDDPCEARTDYGCTLKAMRQDVAKSLRLYGEITVHSRHRLRARRAHRRIEGESPATPARPSKYGITRTLRVVLDLLTVKFLSSYSTRPSHVFGPIGIGSGLAGFAIGLYLTVQKIFYGLHIGGRPLLSLGDTVNFYRLSVRHHGLIG